MKNKGLINLIKEEINNFDFLQNEKTNNENEIQERLYNEEFQKQFICDSLLNVKNKVRIVRTNDAVITSNFENGDNDNLNVDYSVTLAYKYDQDKEPIKFNVAFYGDKIPVTLNTNTSYGDYYTPTQTEDYFVNLNWELIDVFLYTFEEDEVEFKAFKNAPKNIKEIFIREFIQDIIENETRVEFKYNVDKKSISTYC